MNSTISNRRRKGHDDDRHCLQTMSSSSSPSSSTLWLMSFLFILSFILPFGNSIDRIYDHMIINSSKEFYLPGETVNINCTLRSNRYANTSRDIYLYHGESKTTILPWANNHTRFSFDYPDEWTVAFYFVNSSIHDRGTYKCSSRNFSSNNVLVPTALVAIVYPPHKPRLHDCHVIDWKHVTCLISPTIEEQYLRMYHTQQQLQLSVDAHFSENSTLSSAPTTQSRVTIVNAIGGGETRRVICLRARVGFANTDISSVSDVTCHPVIQLAKPGNVMISRDRVTLKFQIQRFDLEPHDVPLLFRVVYRDNRTETNTTVVTSEMELRVSWRPNSAYQVWVEAMYHVIANNLSTVGHAAFVIPSTAPCKNPETVENAFIILPHHDEESCWKMRIYFKPLRETDWCSYKPHFYKADINTSCLNQPMEQLMSDHPSAFMDVYVSAETTDVRISAVNNLGVSEDDTTRRVRISRIPNDIPILVEGDDNDALLSWDDDDEDDDVTGYTVFYCYSPLHNSACADDIEWQQMDRSDRQLNMSSLQNTFDNYLFGISVKRSDANTTIQWTNRYYSLYAAPEQVILTSLNRMDGKIEVKWKSTTTEKNNFNKCLVINYVVCHCIGGGSGHDDDHEGCANSTSCSLLPNTATSQAFDGLNDELTYNFWVRSECRSGLSKYTIHEWQAKSGYHHDFPTYMIIIIFSLVIIVVIIFVALGAHFIKFMKKWHKKLTSGMDIRPPDTIFISKTHPDQKWLSSSSSDNRHSGYRLPSDGFNNRLFVDSSSAPFNPSSWSSFGYRGDDLDTSPRSHRHFLNKLFDRNDLSTDVSGTSVAFTRLNNSTNNEEYCVINWDNRDDDDDCKDGGDDDDLCKDRATANKNANFGGGGVDKDLLTNYCRIQSDSPSTSDRGGSLANQNVGSLINEDHQPKPRGGEGQEICEYPEGEIVPPNLSSDYVRSDALFYDDCRSMFYNHDDNNNTDNIGNDDDVVGVIEEYTINRTSALQLEDSGFNYDNEDDNINDYHGGDDDDCKGDDNNSGDDEAMANIENCVSHPSPQNGEPSSYHKEFTIINTPNYHCDDHLIPMTFYAPLPTEEEEEGILGNFEGAAPFVPEMLNAPYCGLGTLLNDEMRCLITSNEF